MWVLITQDDAPVRKLNIVVISVKKIAGSTGIFTY